MDRVWKKTLSRRKNIMAILLTIKDKGKESLRDKMVIYTRAIGRLIYQKGLASKSLQMGTNTKVHSKMDLDMATGL